MSSNRMSNADQSLRYEVKLTCDTHILAQARSWMRCHPAGFVVAFPSRRVNSMYFDTQDLTNLNENLVGISERQKLRLRWYGTISTRVDRPMLELKQKSGQLGRKEQCQLACDLDLRLPWSDILKTVRSNAGPEWQPALQTIEHPTLINSYQRDYLVTPDGAVRITLDYAQVAYGQRLTPRPNLIARLLIADNVVIEIKAGPEQEDRLHEIASWFPVRRSRNSKYVSNLTAAWG
jgi:hypothetical protein